MWNAAYAFAGVVSALLFVTCSLIAIFQLFKSRTQAKKYGRYSFFAFALLCVLVVFDKPAKTEKQPVQVESSPDAVTLMSSKLHPMSYCDLAADVGYSTRGYKAQSGGCSTQYIDVTTAAGKNGLANNLAYYVLSGDKSEAELYRISLVLNVNNEADSYQAKQEMVRIAKSVFVKIFLTETTRLTDAINTGKSETWTLGEWLVQVKHSSWPSGLGHDVTVNFLPARNK
jgi:hypothetical protein